VNWVLHIALTARPAFVGYASCWRTCRYNICCFNNIWGTVWEKLALTNLQHQQVLNMLKTFSFLGELTPEIWGHRSDPNSLGTSLRGTYDAFWALIGPDLTRDATCAWAEQIKKKTNKERNLGRTEIKFWMWVRPLLGPLEIA